MDTPCPYCGAEQEIDILEVWPDLREFQLDFCCEQTQNEWLEFVDQQPRKDWTKLFRDHAGLDLRNVLPSIDNTLRIDWGLDIQPISRKDAQDFIRENHRHNQPPVGDIFRLSAVNGNVLVAVITVGHPIGRLNQQRRSDKSFSVLEVTRMCSLEDDLTPGLQWNAASQLYSAAAREAKERNAERIITYTLQEELGTSLLSCIWTPLYETKPHKNGWHTPSRPRNPIASPTGIKILWEKRLQPNLADLNKLAATWRKKGKKPRFGTALHSVQLPLLMTNHQTHQYPLGLMTKQQN